MLQTRKKRRNLPPSPPAIPFIGHLHLLRQPIHRSLENLSKKYGPIISLRLGPRPVVLYHHRQLLKNASPRIHKLKGISNKYSINSYYSI
ncbi:hypothetical protein NC651_013562 [Populus alba x Populus x berolinensis]|nr:hypothetical protein NC651_013562 [Populus alba x Populus x berolinensis]